MNVVTWPSNRKMLPCTTCLLIQGLIHPRLYESLHANFTDSNRASGAKATNHITN